MLLTSPMLKNKLSRAANWSAVIFRRPVLLSGTPPVAVWYALNASARTYLVSYCLTTVVEILTTSNENESGASVGDTGSQRKDGSRSRTVGDGLVDADIEGRRRRRSDRAGSAGKLLSVLVNIRRCIVTAYTYAISPVYLLESVPPKVSSPLVVDSSVVGSNEMPTSSASIRPSAKALSRTVGISPPLDVVPSVRSTGPRLYEHCCQRRRYVTGPLCTHPRMPSTPSKPIANSDTPIDWFGMTRLPRVTVSRNSSPARCAMCSA